LAEEEDVQYGVIKVHRQMDRKRAHTSPAIFIDLIKFRYKELNFFVGKFLSYAYLLAYLAAPKLLI